MDHSITRDEWKWTAVAAGLVMLATCVPYLVGWSLAGSERHYMGLLYNTDEPNVYLAWARQAVEGHVLLLDRFTTEPQRPMFFNLFMVLMGWLARATSLPLIAVYQFLRLLCGWGLLLAAYRLAAHYTARVTTRRLAFCLTALSSGLGWALPVINAALRTTGARELLTVDVGRGLVMPEAITFLSLLLYPLFTFSMMLMVLIFVDIVRLAEGAGWKIAARAAVLGLVLANVHTYDLFVLYVLLAGGVLLAWRQAAADVRGRGLRLVCVFLASAPGIAYQWWTFQQNAVFREKALTVTAARPLPDMLLSYGMVAVAAAIGMVCHWRRWREPRWGLLALWVVIGFAIIYAPVSFRRKMIEGLHLPLCLWAALAAEAWWARREGEPPHWRRLGVTALVAVTTPSNLLFIALCFHWLVENNASRWSKMMPPYYLHRDEVAAVRWLADNTQNDEAVLCAPFIGAYIPGLSGNTVYLGHWAETLRFTDKLGVAARFIGGNMTPAERRDFLTRTRVRYLLMTDYERAVFPPLPAEHPGMTIVHANGKARIYQVTAPEEQTP